MTATPIPRTLALTLYGDLDVSVLDEMPPGRTPIVTRRVSDDRADEVWQFVGKQVAAGHQAYVVYPVIEENEESELKAAIKMYKELSKRIFPELQVGLLARPPGADEKEDVMRQVPERRAEHSGFHHRHRSWSGRRQRHGHGDRACGTLWSGAVASASRTHRPWRGQVLLHPDDRRKDFRGRRAPPRRHGPHHRRLPDRRTRS